MVHIEATGDALGWRMTAGMVDPVDMQFSASEIIADADDFHATVDCWKQSNHCAMEIRASDPNDECAGSYEGIGIMPRAHFQSLPSAEIQESARLCDTDAERWAACLEVLRDRLLCAANERGIKLMKLCRMHREEPALFSFAADDVIALREVAVREMSAPADIEAPGNVVKSSAEIPSLPLDGDWVIPPMSLAALVRILIPTMAACKPEKAETILAPFRLMKWPGGTREQWTLDKLKLPHKLLGLLDSRTN